jgi:hypothetical protein
VVLDGGATGGLTAPIGGERVAALVVRPRRG